MKSKYSTEDFIDAWNSSSSIAEAAEKLGLRATGGTYRVLKSKAEAEGLSRGHFTYNRRDKRHTVPLEEVLVENSSYSNTRHLKERLIRAGILVPVCAAPYCPVPNPSVNPFTGESIPLKLSLDHVNGNNTDNRIENLRLLCYHCHGETDTWCGKGKTRLVMGGNLPNPKTKFCDCGREILYASVNCGPCANKIIGRKSQKITYPEAEAIVAGIESMGYSAFARTIGVSCNGLRKHMRTRGIPLVKVKVGGRKKQLA